MPIKNRSVHNAKKVMFYSLIQEIKIISTVLDNVLMEKTIVLSVIKQMLQTVNNVIQDFG